MSRSLAKCFVGDMVWKLTNDMSGVSELSRPQFRATPSGFSVIALLVTQGCATFVSLTVAPPRADIDPPRWGYPLIIIFSHIFVQKAQ